MILEISQRRKTGTFNFIIFWELIKFETIVFKIGLQHVYTFYPSSLLSNLNIFKKETRNYTHFSNRRNFLLNISLVLVFSIDRCEFFGNRPSPKLKLFT